MVMEKEFGRDMMRKFLKYEMDSYLSQRGREMLEEKPLREVGAQQGYVHYRKGSIVKYYLREMIGEDKVNAALKSLVDKFAYQSAPYPTSVDLVEALRKQTPSEFQYLLSDLFEEITLFENRTVKTTYKKLADDKFEVSLDIQCQKFQADKEGKQSQIEINDWIDIGAFAKPDEGLQFGKTLHRERVKIDQEENSFKFVVAEEPVLAGVDPFLLLIDRLPDDNMKKPVLTVDEE
jgi:ABC-2 type transport system permease protein